jgi:hypothetical protein
MDVKIVKKSSINSSIKRRSKFKPLLEAIDKLKPGGGHVVEVSYTTEKNVNSMRTAVYQYSKLKNMKIKSQRDIEAKKIHFERVK